jgi:hypothetical protein
MQHQQKQQQQQPHWKEAQQESAVQQSQTVLPDAGYRLRLVTVERASRLFFHIHKAWVSAHIRAALAETNTPGEAGTPRLLHLVCGLHNCMNVNSVSGGNSAFVHTHVCL